MTVQQPSGAIRSVATGAATDQVLSPDGSKFYTAKNGTVTAYDVATGQQISSWQVGSQLGGIDVSVDGRYLVATEFQPGPTTSAGPYSSTTDWYVHRLDLVTGAVTTYTSHLDGYSSYYFDASFLPDGKVLLTQNYPGSGFTPLTTLDFSTGGFSTSSSGGYAQSGTLTASPDRAHVAFEPSNISDAPVFVYTAGAGVTASHQNYADNISGFNNGVQAISPSGNLVVQGAAGLNVYDGSAHLVIKLGELYPFWASTISGAAFSPTGDKLYLLDSSVNEVFVLSTADWSVLGGYPAGSATTGSGRFGNALQASSDGHYLIVTGTGSTQIINLSLAVSDAGTSGNDVLAGDSGDNILYGFAGNDSIDGAGSIAGDRLNGGGGDDIYYVHNVNDVVVEAVNSGNDTVYSDVSYTLPANVETLILTGSASINATGGARDDLLIGNSGNNRLDGGAGNDRMEGGAGDDTYIVDSPADVVVELSGEGNDTVSASVSYTLPANVENLVLTGSIPLNGTGNAANNLLTGGPGDDQLSGLGGDDILSGGSGRDVLTGGAGIDTLTGGLGNDVFRDTAAGLNGDTITDFAAGDKIVISDATPSGFSFALSGHTLTYTGGSLNLTTVPDGTFVATANSAGGVILSIGAPSPDAVQQPAGAIRSVATGAVKDIVLSPDASKFYTARNGAITAYDVATGQALSTWQVGSELGGIDVSLDGRYLVATEFRSGTVTSSATYPYTTTDWYVYRLDLTTGTVSTYTAHLPGYSSHYYDASFLPDGKVLLTQDYGFGPLTTLDFATGTFSTSNGSYAQDGVLTASPDRVHIAIEPENISDAPVFVYTAGTGVTASHQNYVDNISGFNNGVQAISPSGNLVLQGAAGLNVYDGSAHLVVKLGQLYPFWTSSISGAAFSPTGDKLYLLDSSSNKVFVLSTADWSVLGGYPTGSATPAAGGSFGNALQASSDGLYLLVTGTASTQIIDLSLAVSDGGTSGNDILSGDSGDNGIYGFDGNDSIDGGGSVAGDRLYGGGGDDTYHVHNVNDVVIETVGSGNDTVYSDVSYTVPANVETLVLTGSADINATGRAADDRLIGNSGNNRLDGGAGNDRMEGAAGDDTYIVDSPADMVVELPGEGNDTVYSSVGYVLPANVENLVLAGSIGLSGTGNGANNQLTGGPGDDHLSGLAGDDVLLGGAGWDVLTGGAGIDTLTGGQGYDIFRDSAAGLNGDTITDFTAGDKIEITDATLAGFSFSVTGNTLTYTGGSLTLGAVPEGTIIATATRGGGVTLSIGTPTPDPIEQPAGAIRSVATGAVTDQVFSPDGSKFYTARNGTITAYDTVTGQQLSSWQVGNKLGGIDVSPDGRYLVATEFQAGPTTSTGSYSSTTDWYVHRLDLTTGAVTTYTSHLTGSTSYYYDASFLSDGKVLLTQNYPGSGFTPLTTLDLVTGAFTAPNASYYQSGVLTASPDRAHVAIELATSDAPVLVYTAGIGVTASHQNYADNISGSNNGVQAISPSGNLIAQGGAGLNIYDGSAHLVVKLGNLYPFWASTISGMAFSPDGSKLYLLDSATNDVFALSTADWSVLGSYPTGSATPAPTLNNFGNSLQASSDGHHLLVIGAASAQIIDLSLAVPDQGTTGNDILIGHDGGDILYGFGGNDTITGGAGNDTLTGGAGNDVFLDTAAGLNGDTITDFQVGDKIVIRDADIATFQYSLTGQSMGGTLNYTGGALTLTMGMTRRFVATAASGGGVQLAFMPQIVRNDFNGSGRSGILWRNDNGQLSDWLSNANGGFASNDGNAFANVPTSWHVADTGDFNGDGRSDILWRNDNGQLSDWLGNANGGFTPNDANAFTMVGTDWHVTATGDFNGDGRSDILWRNTNGQLSDWLGTASGGFTANDANAFTAVATAWQVAGTGDFNGDGRDDILWRNSNGQLSDWLGTNNGGFASNDANAFTNVPVAWHVAGTGDFNGDGFSDILWRNDNGQLSDWLGTASGGFTPNDANAFTNVSTDWHVTAVGDYNGDGRSDILWRNDNGQLSDWLSTSNGGFTPNDANALTSVPTVWKVQSHNNV